MEAKFCDDCPLQGRCSGELTDLKVIPVNVDRFGPGLSRVNLAAVVDARRRPSQPLDVPISLKSEEVKELISQCRSPKYIEKGIFRKRTEAECRAIGQYACKDPQLRDLARHVL